MEKGEDVGCKGHVRVLQNLNEEEWSVTARLPLRRRTIPVRGREEQAWKSDGSPEVT